MGGDGVGERLALDVLHRNKSVPLATRSRIPSRYSDGSAPRRLALPNQTPPAAGIRGLRAEALSAPPSDGASNRRRGTRRPSRPHPAAPRRRSDAVYRRGRARVGRRPPRGRTLPTRFLGTGEGPVPLPSAGSASLPQAESRRRRRRSVSGFPTPHRILPGREAIVPASPPAPGRQSRFHPTLRHGPVQLHRRSAHSQDSASSCTRGHQIGSSTTVA